MKIFHNISSWRVDQSFFFFFFLSSLINQNRKSTAEEAAGLFVMAPFFGKVTTETTKLFLLKQPKQNTKAGGSLLLKYKTLN